MPSVFTIAGADLEGVEGPPAPKKARKAKKAKSTTQPKIGECRCSYNPRTQKYVESCYLGPGKAGGRTGWRFTKGGEAHCPRK